MSELREIPDQTYAEAGAILRWAAGTGPSPEREPMPGFASAVAATAVALADGAPTAFRRDGGTGQFHYVAEGAEEWRHMHAAVARAIDLDRSGGGSFDTVSDAMVHMASDVMHQARARDLSLAVANTDPVFQEGMSAGDRDLVSYARTDPDVATALRHESIGAYHRLDRYARGDVAHAMANGERVPREVTDRLMRSAGLIEDDLEHVPDRATVARLAVDDLHSMSKPLFRTVLPEHERHAAALVAGERRPHGWADQAVVAHAALTERGEVSRAAADVRMGAYARALAAAGDASYSAPMETAAFSAVRIEADVRLVTRSRELEAEFAGTPEALSPHSFHGQVADGVARSEMTADAQVSVLEQLDGHERVPGIVAARLFLAADDVARGDLLVGRAREEAEREASRRIVYEGIDLSDQDARWREGMFLPGDRVRLDPAARISGVDPEDLAGRVGTEPLVVARSVVEGVDRDNTLGGTYRAALTSYEFEGVEGRYPSKAFHHERGEHHVYGVLMEDAGRLWLAPMSSDADAPDRAGAAREVTASGGVNLEPVEAMRDLVRGAPAVGEYVFVPDAHGAASGPVELVGNPWMADASAVEAALARAMVAEERMPAPARAALAASVGAAAGMA